MAIKQIQLRGISRTPSDRMNSDGGVAESLNFQIEQQENAPMLPPKIKSGVLPNGYSGGVVFIHKTKLYTNYIGHNGNNLVWIKPTTTVTIGESIPADCKVYSLGNVLVVLSSQGRQHFFFKENTYKPLGSSIPFPDIEIVPEEQQVTASATVTYYNGVPGIGGLDPFVEKGEPYKDFYEMRSNVWNTTLLEMPANDTNLATMLHEVKAIRNYFDFNLEKNRVSSRVFSKPVFIKYALVLYDGTEIDSTPYLMYTTKKDVVGSHTFTVMADDQRTIVPSGDRYRPTNMYITASSILVGYKIKLLCSDMFNTILSDWGDVVTSVRVYLSEDISQLGYDNVAQFSADTSGIIYHITPQSTDVQALDGSGTFEMYANEFNYEAFRNVGAFYRVGEYTVEEANNEDITIEYISNDDRAVKSVLSETPVNNKHTYYPQELMSYNGRLYGYNVEEFLYKGSRYMNGAAYGVQSIYDTTSIKYIVRDALGQRFSTDWRLIDINKYNSPFIAYPDTRCYEAIIKSNGTSGVDGYFIIKMHEHKFMRMSYFFPEVDDNYLYTILDGVKAGTYTVSGIEYVAGSYDDADLPTSMTNHNKLYSTPADNFYLFSNAITIDAPIIGLSKNTQALSSGQYGEYPILVFSEEGLWGITINDAGDMVSLAPLQRDIAKQGRIWQIDGATVYLTSKTLSIVTGSQTQDIAPNMVGRHYSMESGVVDIIMEHMPTEMSDTKHTLEDTNNFMKFMEGLSTNDVQMVYDYNGGRCIFFNKDKTYAYVLMMQTNTWHKIQLPDNYKFVNALNSYPEALVVLSKEEELTSDNPSIDTGGTSGNTGEPSNGTSGTIDTEVGGEESVNPGGQIVDTELSEGETIGGETIGGGSIAGMIDEAMGPPVIYVSPSLQTKVKTTSIFDFSTALADTDNSTEVVSVIATRALSLDNPDTLKTINHIRIRGNYERYEHKTREFYKYYLKRTSTTEEIQILQSDIDNWNSFGVTLTLQQMRDLADGVTTEVYLGTNDAIEYDDLVEEINASVQVEFVELKTERHEEELSELDKTKPRVQYILLGSQDGINYHRLGSLRGKSWKMFRIIILAKFRPYERISWIDVEYETRQTNKLR